MDDIKDLMNKGIYHQLTEDDFKKIETGITGTYEESIQTTKAENEGTDQPGADDFPTRLIEMYMPWMIDDEMVESVFIIDYVSGVYVSGKPLTAVSPIGRRPWVIEQFIRRTGRPYGIGMPESMRGLAKELDAIHNQRIDAGTIGIIPFGFYRAASSFNPDIVHLGPGVMVPVDDIKDVMFPNLQTNLVSSYQEERIVIEYIEKLTATSAYQMGRESDVVKSRATATGTMALISQGEQAYTLIGLRCQRMLSRVMTKILQMYQCFMPANFAERIVGDAGELLFPQGLTPEEIDGGYDAYMTLDSTAGNKAMERQANMVLMQSAQQLILLAQDPRGYEIAKDFLISIGKIDYEKYLGPKPEPKQQQGLLPVMQGDGQGGGLLQGAQNVA